uniref:Uncharacterized protein MANES_04G061700 n=1 Tax=Rhizophora mucronata TaxID=61149 RepID=A0A2P2MS10_RHIMU
MQHSGEKLSKIINMTATQVFAKHLREVNKENEPFTGIFPCSWLFERSLHHIQFYLKRCTILRQNKENKITD